MPPTSPRDDQVADEPALSGDETVVLPLVEERLRVEARQRTTARVRVRLTTESRTERVRGDLAVDSVEVARIPVGRFVEAPPAIREEGDVTIISVVEERLVVEKRLVLVEEIHLTRRHTTRPHDETVTLRRQRAAIERIEGDQ